MPLVTTLKDSQSLANPQKWRRIRDRHRADAPASEPEGHEGMAAMFLEPGETLGSYRILEVVSIGGMAIVYRAEHLYLGREVALKVIAPRIAGDDAFRRRFRSEGRAAAKLDHPNIVAIHDSGEVDGWLFLAMRFVRGETLADRIRRGRLTAEQTISLLVPIADALDAAHAARNRPPRCQTPEHHHQRHRGPVSRRLRHREGGRDDRVHGDPRVHRNLQLRRPRADSRAPGDSRDRHLRADRGSLPLLDRPAGICVRNRGRDPACARLRATANRHGGSPRRSRAQRAHCARDGEGARGAVLQRQRTDA